ncbi:MAG: TolC family protein [Deltaproteobacteria bacterium]|nr:TolC family protein [Deltaproteobacteria bacterium]
MMKGCLKTVLLALLLMLLFFTSAASDDGVLRLSLKDSIEMALERSVIIHSAQEGVRASEAERKGARSSFLPQFSTSYTYTRLNESPEVPIFDITTMSSKMVEAGKKDNYNWELELTQPIFTGGAILNSYEISKIDLEVSHLSEASATQDIVLEVKNSYYNILKSERILELANQSVQQLQAHRDKAQSFYDVGIIPKNDLLYAEVELANGNQDLVRAENALNLAKARFNTVIRRDIHLPIEVEDILTYKPFEKGFDECLSMGLQKRPEIKAYELEYEKAGRAVKLAKSGFYPKLNVVGNYSRYGEKPDVGGSKYHDSEAWYVAAVTQWNFWEWGKTKFGVDASRSREKQAMDMLVNMKDGISLQIKNSYLLLKEAEKHIFVAEKAIEQAEENFRINRERYKEQVATSTDVIDAQTLLTKTKTDYYNALSNYNIALGTLERAMGISYSGEEPE